MKYLALVAAALVVFAGGLLFLNNQSEKREANQQWSQFIHKDEACRTAKQYTLDMKRLWLKKGQRPTADVIARWKSQEAQACQQ